MINHQELVIFPKDLPLKIQLYQNNPPSSHWHPSTELLFVLKGSIHLTVDDNAFILIPEDICIINAHSIHQIEGDDYEILSISFYLDSLKFTAKASDMYFDLNSCEDTHNKKYDYVRHIVAQLVKINASGENRYMTLGLIYTLIGHLNDFFLTTAPLEIKTDKNQERIQNILSHIDSHYKDNLQLNDLAQMLSLSPSYLSSFFKKVTGTTYLEYYNELRLKYAVNEMLTSDTILETIAYGNGFSDYRSFTKLFKKKYNQLPSDYRNNHKATKNSMITKPLDNEDALLALSKYLVKSEETIKTSFQHDIDRDIFIDGGIINYQIEGIPLRHSYKEVCTLGSAKLILYSEVQAMLKKVQKEIGYKQIKFHGILSDEMMVYYEKNDGTPYYSFTLVNKVIDFLLSINLKPFVQLSFMPRALASDPGKMIDMWHFNTSPPKSLHKWRQLIEAFVENLIERYSRAEVCSWKFCVWNEPDGTVESFGWAHPEEFYNFYMTTYEAVKGIEPTIKFGTPSLLLNPDQNQSWALDFLNYAIINDCTADFLNIHYYDNDFSKANIADFFSLDNLAKVCPLNEDPLAFTKFIHNIKQDQRRLKIEGFPIYLTEWNLTVSQRDLINDTCFKSCYLTKNLLENYDRLESFGYWVLTDFIEELQLPNELFHGGLGLFTFNGIPKAHYNIFKLMASLSNEMIGKGQGYFITKNTQKITMMLYNYEHFSKLFATGMLFDMNEDNRYAAFSKMNPVTFNFILENLPCESVLIKEQIVNQQHGSSYDVWKTMGSKSTLSQSELDILRQMAEPNLQLRHDKIINNQLSLTAKLEPLEVRLIEVEFIDPL